MDVDEAARQIRANTVYHCGEHGEAIPLRQEVPKKACQVEEARTEAAIARGGALDAIDPEMAAAFLRDAGGLVTAYAALEEAEEKLFLAEENRIEAAIARETAYLAAISEAIADGITDPGRQQQKAQRATRDQLTALHRAEKASRQAQHGYKLAGIRLDSLNRRIQLLQLLQERGK